VIEFLDPAGFALGLAAAGVLAAHLVRRRARKHVVPFLQLWTATIALRPGGFGARVARWLDLALVVLACALVALAAGRPQVPGTPDRIRDLVLVMDGGVSLRAGSRLPNMRKIAEAEIRRRARGTRFAVIGVSDEGATFWSGDDVGKAIEAVREQQAGWTAAPRDEAIELAKVAAQGLREPDVVLVTHRRGRAEGLRLRTVAEAVRNAGVEGLAVVGDPEGGGTVARLVLRGDGKVAVEGKGETLFDDEVHGTREVQVPLPRSGETTLVVKSEADGFAPDDTVYVLPSEPPRPHVLVVSEKDPSPFLTAALQALESTGAIQGPLDRTTPDHAGEAAGRYDLLVFDRCAPPERIPGMRALYLAPPPGALPFRLGDEGAAGALFDVKKDHPLLLGFDLARVAPLRARPILGGEAIATAAPGPVMATAPGWVALGFDPDRSLFAASPAYPLFLRNAIEFLAPSAAADRPEFYAIGEKAPIQGLATIKGQGTLRVGAELLGPPGFWKFPDATIAVDFLEKDLDLAPPDEPSDPLPDVGTPGVPARPLAPHFAAGAIVLLLLAWWAFWRS
jgi:hypothetical protein